MNRLIKAATGPAKQVVTRVHPDRAVGSHRDHFGIDRTVAAGCAVSFDLYPESSLVMPEVHSDDRDDVPAFSWFLHWKLPEPRLSWLKIRNQWRPRVRPHLASISFMDSQVGRLLDALDATGRAHETEELYDHRADPHEWKNLASDPRSAEVNAPPPKGVGFVVQDSSPIPSKARHKVHPPEAG